MILIPSPPYALSCNCPSSFPSFLSPFCPSPFRSHSIDHLGREGRERKCFRARKGSIRPHNERISLHFGAESSCIESITSDLAPDRQCSGASRIWGKIYRSETGSAFNLIRVITRKRPHPHAPSRAPSAPSASSAHSAGSLFQIPRTKS